MEMSAAYMRETVDYLTELGFTVERDAEVRTRDGATVFERERFTVIRKSTEKLVLEVLTYPGGEEKYFLEVTDWHGMHSYSFPLDSWKYRGDRIEFKYLMDPVSGLGHAFTLHYQRGAPRGG